MEDQVTARRVRLIVSSVEKQVRAFTVPIVTKFSHHREPFLVLVSCMLSLRTRDETTAQASARLFEKAANPAAMVNLSARVIEKLIFPVGFYRTKARAIIESSRRILESFSGKVPDTIEELLTLPGVGRKTANLVLGLGFGLPAICVDTHVHRISNRLGWIKTKNALDTEKALENIVPQDLWIKLNTVLVTFGQNICVPISPRCSVCSVHARCARTGVGSSR